MQGTFRLLRRKSALPVLAGPNLVLTPKIENCTSAVRRVVFAKCHEKVEDAPGGRFSKNPNSGFVLCLVSCVVFGKCHEKVDDAPGRRRFKIGFGSTCLFNPILIINPLRKCRTKSRTISTHRLRVTPGHRRPLAKNYPGNIKNLRTGAYFGA